MKNSKVITVAELETMLLNWNFGAQPVSLQYVTDPTFASVKSKPLFPEVKKIANIGGMVGYSYTNSVNNQLERENKVAEFLAQPLWKGKGKRLSTALATHIEKNTMYISIKHQSTFKSVFFDFDKLEVVAKAILQPFLKPYVAPTNQGVDEGKEVYHKEISLSNVRKLKFKKVTYLIQH